MLLQHYIEMSTLSTHVGSTKRLEINSETKRRPEKLGNLSEEKLGKWAVINWLRYSCPVWYTKNVLYKM